jgi:ATP-dependent DNA ligase
MRGWLPDCLLERASDAGRLSALHLGDADLKPMLSTRVTPWPANSDWVMEPKWDGFRLLIAIDAKGRVRAWSRRGASLGDYVEREIGR